MVLPSQFSRSDNRRSHMFRKRGFGRLPLWIGAAVVLGFGAWGVGGLLLGESDAASGDEESTDLAMTGQAAPPSVGPTGDSGGRSGGNRAGSDPDRAGDRSGATGGEAGPSPDEPLQSQAQMAEALQRARQHMVYAFQIDGVQPVQARHHFTQALATGALTEGDVFKVGVAMKKLSNELVFSPLVVPDDPFSMTYTIKPGDSLEAITKRRSLLVDWRFLKRINGIQDVRRIQAGQSIKLITGPFHAVIHKSDFRLDLFMGDGTDKVFVRSFSVGLGEYNSTPVGMFRISSRLINPEWVNPRTRQKYLPDDPANPIGERWMGLIGVDDYTRDFTGYGIHGTVEPDSIGREQSMGCVRMLPEDVELLFELLLSDVSTVEIRP